MSAGNITWIESFTVEGRHVIAKVHSEIPAPEGESEGMRVRISVSELTTMLESARGGSNAPS